MWALNNKINEQTKQNEIHRYREHIDEDLGDGWQRWKGLEVKIGSYKNSHRGVNYSIGNVVNNVIIMYGDRWGLELPGCALCKVYECLITLLYSWNQCNVVCQLW